MCVLANQLHSSTTLAPLWGHHTIRPALSDRCGPLDELGIVGGVAVVVGEGTDEVPPTGHAIL
ncbi:hypothetical protein ANCDUO_17170 [Ancylostoma duodenale]|uniref:Uncharacterized protein n=1 Tax=Ancylostoma duodenale TaxID=51022 RepID=A0A0C2G6M5_9BILA|nr:hypothetical protein ANCDUO_17170 [Ancylostoma duodenale]